MPQSLFHTSNYLQPLICGIKEQFDAILSQIQNEVVAERHLEGTEAGQQSPQIREPGPLDPGAPNKRQSSGET